MDTSGPVIAEFQLTPAEVARAATSTLRPNRIVINLAFSAILAAIGVADWTVNRPLAVFMFVLAGIYVLLTLLSRVSIGRLVERRSPGLLAPQRVTVSDAGIEMRSYYSCNFLYWHALGSMRRVGDLYCIRPKVWRGTYVVPRRGLRTEADEARFLALVNHYLPPPNLLPRTTVATDQEKRSVYSAYLPNQDLEERAPTQHQWYPAPGQWYPPGQGQAPGQWYPPGQGYPPSEWYPPPGQGQPPGQEQPPRQEQGDRPSELPPDQAGG